MSRKLKCMTKKYSTIIYIKNKKLIVLQTNHETKETQLLAAFSILSVWDMLVEYFITKPILKSDISGFYRRQKEAFQVMDSRFQ